MKHEQNRCPFRLENSFAWFGNAAVNRAIATALEYFSGLRHLGHRYRTLPFSAGPREFLQRVFETLNVRYEVDDDELARIPADGPVIIVANHPFGGIEGLVLADVMLRRRGDVKILANYLLGRIPELRELFIGVDPFGGDGAVARNRRPMKSAMHWLQRGGLMAAFPAGTVSHFQPLQGAITDPPWSDSIARLVKRTGAPVVPVYFHGANTWLFQVAGLVHRSLRTALLPRELISTQGKTLTLRIGEPITPKQMEPFERPTVLAEFLRQRTYALGRDRIKSANWSRPLVPVIGGRDRAVLKAEIGALSAEQCLLQSGTMQVYYARAHQIPSLLQEIGRLREITFREVGEGTGKSVDLDLYDNYYLHLFVWDSEARQLVGAYRLGLADEILARYGKKGLYTHSLFHYKRRLLEEINPAMELGRSFVRKEYQRGFAPLLLLWKGIGQFVHRHPRYRILFGPVTISSEYESLSQQLMVEFLRANNFVPQLARLVKPRRPFRSPGRDWYATDFADLKDIDGLTELVAKIEKDAKGPPILLKQYLKLGGRLLGFNVDPEFNNALDGLIMVDLAQTEPRVLMKYMGRDEAEAFLARHAAQPPMQQVAS